MGTAATMALSDIGAHREVGAGTHAVRKVIARLRTRTSWSYGVANATERPKPTGDREWKNRFFNHDLVRGLLTD
jgi:hypothetical protein